MREKKSEKEKEKGREIERERERERERITKRYFHNTNKSKLQIWITWSLLTWAADSGSMADSFSIHVIVIVLDRWRSSERGWGKEVVVT